MSRNMPCVCGMTFLCGSTLVQVSLLQAGTVEILSQMFKSDVSPQQTNKIQDKKYEIILPVADLLRVF